MSNIDWIVRVGEWEKVISLNFDLAFRYLIPNGLESLRAKPACEVAEIIWSTFRYQDPKALDVPWKKEIQDTKMVKEPNTWPECFEVLKEIWQACIEAESTDRFYFLNRGCIGGDAPVTSFSRSEFHVLDDIIIC